MKTSQPPAPASPGAPRPRVNTPRSARLQPDRRTQGDPTPVPPGAVRDPGSIEYASWLSLLQRSAP